MFAQKASCLPQQSHYPYTRPNYDSVIPADILDIFNGLDIHFRTSFLHFFTDSLCNFGGGTCGKSISD
jgi:hypothetical protein